jgi:hypothetical protein
MERLQSPKLMEVEAGANDASGPQPPKTTSGQPLFFCLAIEFHDAQNVQITLHPHFLTESFDRIICLEETPAPSPGAGAEGA